MAHTSFFKEPRARKVDRALRSTKRKSAEQTVMGAVRKRDKYCRFPLCGCKKFGLHGETSHQRHRGMGGNPYGDRTTRTTMIYVCVARHRANVYSIDRHTLKWEALTDQGADGPIRWLMDYGFVPDAPAAERWVEIARERSPHVYETLTADQYAVLKRLAEMRS